MYTFHRLFSVYSFTVLVIKQLSAYYKVASYLYSPEHMLCPKSCEEPHSTNIQQVLYQYVDDDKWRKNDIVIIIATTYNKDMLETKNSNTTE